MNDLRLLNKCWQKNDDVVTDNDDDNDRVVLLHSRDFSPPPICRRNPGDTEASHFSLHLVKYKILKYNWPELHTQYIHNLYEWEYKIYKQSWLDINQTKTTNRIAPSSIPCDQGQWKKIDWKTNANRILEWDNVVEIHFF